MLEDKTNVLKGKTLYAFGTSIVNGHLANVSFVEDVAKQTGLTCKKYAVNGASARTTDPNNILVQVDQASEVKPDFIIFDGIANDAYPEVVDDPKVLGEISTDFDSTLDTTTYCGGFEKVCKTLLTKYQGAKVFYLATHKTPARQYRIQKVLYDLSVEICHKWSIEVIDLFQAGSLNTFIQSYQQDYSYDVVDENGKNHAFGGSGTHPNADAYLKYYDPIITNRLLLQLEH